MKLTIITVNYNNLAGLKRTSESILCQTMHEFEWIVIDGGSNDGSKEYIESLSSQPTIWRSEPDTGIYNAMNKGIRLAHGDYLLFMNSGDSLFSNDTLYLAQDELVEDDIIYGDALFCGPDNQRTVTYPEKFTLYDLWNSCTPCHQATFIKSSLLKERGGYSENYRIASDYRQWIIWKKEGRSFRHLKQTICYYMLDGISSTQLELHKEEHDRIINELFNEDARLQMEQIDYLKSFYEDAVSYREVEIKKRDNEIRIRDEEIKKRDNEIRIRDEEIRKRDSIIEEVRNEINALSTRYRHSISLDKLFHNKLTRKIGKLFKKTSNY